MSEAFEVSDDDLRDELTTHGARVARSEARLLALIGELDARDAWGGKGLLSCAHWLSLFLGFGLKAARERVRVARALRDLPLIAAAMEGGRISYAQVRAVTRVATPAQQQMWLELAKSASGGQLERLTRGVNRARAQEADGNATRTSAKLDAEHRLRSHVGYDDDGTMVITIRVPAEEGAVVLAGLRQSQDLLDRQAKAARQASAEASSPDQLRRATRGEGWVELARQGLDRLGSEHPDLARKRRSMLTLHVDPLTGCGRLPDGELLNAAAVERVRLMTPGSVVVSAPDLTAHNLGRTSREPSQALRELVGAVDGERCRFPGCTRHGRLQAHHVRFWRQGGPTNLANLVLVCARHHSIIHKDGWLLELHPDRRLSVTSADGTPLLHHPGLADASAEASSGTGGHDDDADLGPDTLRSARDWHRVDLGYAVSVMLAQAA